MHSFPLQIWCILNLFCGYNIQPWRSVWVGCRGQWKGSTPRLYLPRTFFIKWKLETGIIFHMKFSKWGYSWHALCWCLTNGSHLPFSAETNVSSHHSVPVVGRWLFPSCCILCTELHLEKPESIFVSANFKLSSKLLLVQSLHGMAKSNANLYFKQKRQHLEETSYLSVCTAKAKMWCC